MVRHSACTEADLEFRADERALMLRVSDNGRGFDPSSVPQMTAFGAYASGPSPGRPSGRDVTARHGYHPRFRDSICRSPAFDRHGIGARPPRMNMWGQTPEHSRRVEV